MIYPNVYEMADAILDYVKNNPGCTIICDDRVKQLTLGFRDRSLPFFDTARWDVQMKRVTAMIKEPSGIPQEVLTWLNESFSNYQGRKEAAQAFTEGRLPWVRQ
jgi:hypothetical protein